MSSQRENAASTAALSQRSACKKGTSRPVRRSTRRSASALELDRSSTTAISKPASVSATQVWLPM